LFSPGMNMAIDRFAQVFRNPKPDLMALLEQSGGDANGVRGKSDASKKKARRDKAVRLRLGSSYVCYRYTGRLMRDFIGRHGEACRRITEAQRG